MVTLFPQAVSENLGLKETIFRDLAAQLPPSTILASNTSSISITKIAAATVPQGYTASSEEGQRSAGRVIGECSRTSIYTAVPAD